MVQEWAKVRGYDRYMSTYWEPTVQWLASYTQTGLAEFGRHAGEELDEMPSELPAEVAGTCILLPGKSRGVCSFPPFQPLQWPATIYRRRDSQKLERLVALAFLPHGFGFRQTRP
jgi:hypothetical protein